MNEFGNYAVLYTRNTRDRYFDKPSALNLFEEYELVGRYVGTPEQAFHWFQGENWSAGALQERAQKLIKALNLWHTSMSCGDVLVNLDTYKAYYCARFGFEELPIPDYHVRAVFEFAALKAERAENSIKED